MGGYYFHIKPGLLLTIFFQCRLICILCKILSSLKGADMIPEHEQLRYFERVFDIRGFVGAPFEVMIPLPDTYTVSSVQKQKRFGRRGHLFQHSWDHTALHVVDDPWAYP